MKFLVTILWAVAVICFALGAVIGDKPTLPTATRWICAGLAFAAAAVATGIVG